MEAPAGRELGGSATVQSCDHNNGHQAWFLKTSKSRWPKAVQKTLSKKCQAWFYTKDTHQLQSFLSLCLAVDLNGPAPKPGYQDYRTDTAPQAGNQICSLNSKWNTLESNWTILLCQKQKTLLCSFLRWGKVSKMLKVFWRCKALDRSSRVGWQPAVLGQYTCFSVATISNAFARGDLEYNFFTSESYVWKILHENLCWNSSKQKICFLARCRSKFYQTSGLLTWVRVLGSTPHLFRWTCNGHWQQQFLYDKSSGRLQDLP